jgi:hypothetical protein
MLRLILILTSILIAGIIGIYLVIQNQPKITLAADTGISGTVLLGPTCPVEQIPPSSQCQPKPFSIDLVLTTPDDSEVISSFKSDKDGKFSVLAAPGEYAVRTTVASNVLPYCRSSGTLKVKTGTFTTTTIYCDTGIR